MPILLESIYLPQEPFVDLLPPEIARCYGQSVNAKSIINIFSRTIRPDVKIIHEALAAGGNPETLALSYLKGGNSSNGKMICHISISHMHIHLPHLLIWYWY